MHFPSSSFLALALVALVAAVPTPVEAAAAATSCTPFNYAPILTDSAGVTFNIQIRANNPAYDGHNIQLRPSGGASLVVVDNASPVLAVELVNGTLHSRARNLYNQYYDLGPVGGLRNITTTNTSAEQAFVFRNVTGSGRSFTQTMAEWYMIGDGVTANYGLYQTVTLGFVNGFILCPESNNEYYQVFYNEYLSEPPAYPGCEFVGLQATVAPFLSLNGLDGGTGP